MQGESDGRSDDGSPAGPRKDLLDSVRELILNLDFPSSSPLSEGALAQRFGVSRTPVREVLKQLQSEGLVEIRPRVGTFVREPSYREYAELFDVKEMLEGLAARLLASRGRVAQIDALEDNLAQSREAVKVGDQQRYAELVHGFHHLMVEGADSVKLSQHYTTLMNQLAYHRVVTRTLSHPGRLAASLDEHQRVLGRIADKDRFGAESAMRDHVHATSREAMSGKH